MRRHFFIGTLLLLAVANASAQTGADFPTRPVRWLVPFVPGGTADILARFVGEQVAQGWQQTVIIENRPGAGGTVAAKDVLNASADGYTILGGTISTHAINVAIRPGLSYQPIRDFSPVTMLAKAPNLVVAHPSFPARNFKSLVAIARRHPGQVAYGTPGVGTAMHMTGEFIKQLSGADLTHVPYKGGGAVLIDVLGGHVPVAITGFAVAAPHVKRGKLKGIGVTSAQRSPVLPEVPTLAEQGLKDVVVTAWHAVFVKAETPSPIVERLNRSLLRVLNRPDNRKHFERQGVDLVSSTPQELLAFVEAEIKRWTKVARTAGIKVK